MRRDPASSRVNDTSDAALITAMHEALPRLFREIDKLRRGVPVVGDVVDGGRIAWRRAPPRG